MALATTLIGEVTVSPSIGLEIVSGKSLEPAGGGTCAGGAGNGLLCGDHVIGAGGWMDNWAEQAVPRWEPYLGEPSAYYYRNRWKG